MLHSTSWIIELTAVSLRWHSVQTFTGRIVPCPGVSEGRPFERELEAVAPFEFDDGVPVVLEEWPFSCPFESAAPLELDEPFMVP